MSTVVTDGLTGQHNMSIGQTDHTKITHSCILNIEQRSEGIICKKSLKIPNRQSDVVNRRTENTMIKRMRAKRQTMINNILERKLKIKKYEPH